ncbi:anillin [Megalops cyprinoides]|uniref:anillin n=1 Tax=Megalops cyprinoides TaxID=118141 RepID=UPI0018656915|nr:anillin [Megalops cyprinoides]
MDQVTETAEQGSARQVCLQLPDGMDVEECGVQAESRKSLKRQREPLANGEQNFPSSPQPPGGLKRRCLEPSGEENVKPLELWGGSPGRSRLRWAEQMVKPDTPVISSVQARLRQLNQRREGAAPPAQRCLSDPGRGALSGCDPQADEEGSRAELRLIGDAEFRSRVERFELRPPEDGPSLSTPRPRVLSSFARTIQQKLQSAETPSTSRAERIRREREQELRLLKSQPISDNAWLKRSWSDPSLAEQAEPDVQVEKSSSDQWSEVEHSSTTETSASSEENSCFSEEPCPQVKRTDVELTSQEEMNTSEMIDQMFKGVLDITVEEEEGEKEEDGNGNSNGEESGEEKKEQGDEKMNAEDENKPLDTSLEELLTIPPSCILSPLSKSLAAVVTPMRVAPSPQLDPPPLLLTPEEVPTPPADSPPLYSIDAYRNQRQLSQPPVRSVTPAVSRRVTDRSRLQPPVNTKEKITLLNEEAAKLQGVITQTLQALSCCTDEGHGRGSLEEVEAEKLLLVSYEKRSALLAEVSRLREGNMGQAGVCDPDSRSLSTEPCRGTVTISNVQLPLKVEFICPARTRTGQPTHYFFVLIRYGACNIVATPLATAADARNGDTISFPTAITLQDIRANFQIDVEVYSLSRSTGNNLNMERRSTKYKVTPKKLLNTISRFNHSLTSATMPSMNPRRSSNFSLVGSHKITLASLGQSKFPLDKVPFLSPLAGNIYLRLECEGHSHVQHRGFLTMFEDVNGFGAWHRHWFCLEESRLSYWNYPNDEHIRAPEGSISLASCSSHCVRPVTRDSCARPNTFELVNTRILQQNQCQGLDKRWFSADTREEREEWMEKLNQSLLDLRTWKPRPVTSDPQPCGPSRESIL